MKATAYAAIALSVVACAPTELPLPDRHGTSSSTSTSASSGSGGSGGGGGVTSGTRLKSFWLRGEDGASARIGVAWLDVELNLRCSAAETPDGLIRCLPLCDKIVQASQSTFVDPTCSTRAVAAIGNSAPSLAISTDSYVDTCSQALVPRVRQYAVGAPAAHVYMVLSGACVEVQKPDEYSYYALGPEVNYAQYATLSIVAE